MVSILDYTSLGLVCLGFVAGLIVALGFFSMQLKKAHQGADNNISVAMLSEMCQVVEGTIKSMRQTQELASRAIQLLNEDDSDDSDDGL